MQTFVSQAYKELVQPLIITLHAEPVRGAALRNSIHFRSRPPRLGANMLQLCPPIHKGEAIQVEAHPPRKLAVILHADVVGSTSLVQKNEPLAHERIRDTFQRFSETISAYNRIAHEIRGDALVAEFDRASDEARYQLSALELVEEDYEGAMEQLLEIMRRDRGFRDDVGRNSLLAIFGILSNKGPLVERYRSLLMDHLH